MADFFGSLANILTGGLSSAIDTGFGMLSQNHSAGLQKELMRDQAKIQDDYQRKLMQDQYSIMKSSLQNAGFSSAAATQGGFGSVAGSNVSASASAPGMVMPNTNLAGVAQASAQTKLLEEEARGKRIENDNKQTVIDLNNKLTEATTHEKETVAKLNIKELEHITKEIQKADAQIRNLDQNTRTQAAQEFDLIASAEIRYEDLNIRTQLAIAQIRELEEKAKLDKAQAAQCYKVIAKMSEEINLLQKQYELSDKELSILDISIREGNLRTDLLEKYGDKEHENALYKLYQDGLKSKAEVDQITNGTIEVGLPFGIGRGTYSPGSDMLDVIFGDDHKSGPRWSK